MVTNTGNVALTAAGNITTNAGGIITTQVTTGNISVTSTAGNIVLDQPTFQTTSGSVGITAAGTVNVATTNKDNLTITAIAGASSGITVSGSSITMGNAGAKAELISATDGSITMNATSSGVGATVYYPGRGR